MMSRDQLDRLSRLAQLMKSGNPTRDEEDEYQELSSIFEREAFPVAKQGC